MDKRGGPWANGGMLRLVAGLVVLCAVASGACAAEYASMPSPPEPPSVYGSGQPASQGGDLSMTAEAEVETRALRGGGLARLMTLGRQQKRAQGSAVAAAEPEAVAGAGAPLPAARAPDKNQKLVVSGAVEVAVDDVAATAAAIRAEATRRGATIVTDKVQGARYGVSATLQFRILPAEVDPFIAWLGQKGSIESSNLAASDVSREYFDQELRLRTLRVTLERLEKILVDRQNVALADVLAVEREMTRVRGEIEQLEGVHRYLADRVERATLDVHLSTRSEFVARAPAQSFMVAAHATMLHFADDDGARNRNRFGAGVRMLFGRRFDLALDVFPSRGLDDRSILFSLGGALYSDFLGGGRRRFLNPYIGLLAGGAEVSGDGAFTAGASLGLELYRGPRLLLDLTTRAQILLYGKDKRPSDTALQAALGVGMPF